MIGKITAPRGERVEPLIYYLYGPGRHEEHTDPHVVAGWRHPAELEPPLREGGGRDFRRLLGLLNQPHAAMGERGFSRPVWHCSMRAAPGDKMLSDDEWAQIACDVLHRTGLSAYGQEDDAVRWVAVRHGDDHIHIVAMLARQDGRRPRLPNDRYRVRDACLAAEQRYGLRSTAPGDRTAARRPARAESEKAARRGLEEAPRVTLRRHVSMAAAAAGSEQEFFARLDAAGVLVRKRFSARTPGEVTGYAVALSGDTSRGGEPVWYGGGKLAADMTLPKLRRRWTQPGSPADSGLTAGDRRVRAAAARPDRIGRPLVPALANAVLDTADRAGGPQGGLPDLRVVRCGLARLHRSWTGRDRIHGARIDAARVDRKPASWALRYRHCVARDFARPGQPGTTPGHPDRRAFPLTAQGRS